MMYLLFTAELARLTEACNLIDSSVLNDTLRHIIVSNYTPSRRNNSPPRSNAEVASILRRISISKPEMVINLEYAT